ncbi:MAG: hypothetical protein R3A47_11435 [Polyangiales bacterium]
MKKTVRIVLRAWMLCSVALPLGCADDLPSKSEIARPRSIGIHASPNNDPSIAMAEPGDELDVSIVMAEPGRKPLYQWRFVACLPDGSVNPISACSLDALLSCEGCDGGAAVRVDPFFRVSIPDLTAIGDADSVLIVGAVCADGEPLGLQQIDAIASGTAESTSACADSAKEGEFVTARIPIHRDTAVNHHPTISSVQLSSAAWLQIADSASPIEGCAGMGFREVGAGAPPLSVALVSTEDSREVVSTTSTDGTTTEQLESLIVSWYATDGELSSVFSFIDGEDAPVADVAWLPPLTAPTTGTLVRFYFVLRDDGGRGSRGGVAVTQRALCVIGNGV